MSARVVVSAIVPATDGPATLARCLAAIAGTDEPPDETIVVDECAAPGPAAARNAGAARARGDVLVFVDADVLPHRDAFRRVRTAFAEDPALAALFGSYDDEPPAGGLVSTFRNLLHHHVHQEGTGDATTFWAGLGAIRRDAFENAGGFDAARFPYASVEDVELGMRLHAAGERIRLDPALLGTHLKRWTFAEMIRTDVSRRALPWASLLLERGGSTALNLGWRHRLSALSSIAAAAALATGRLRAASGALAALVVLNRRFYALLVRRGGAVGVVSGVCLHVAHHVAAAVGAAAALARRH